MASASNPSELPPTTEATADAPQVTGENADGALAIGFKLTVSGTARGLSALKYNRVASDLRLCRTLLVGMAASDRDFGGALWHIATGYVPRMACVTERDSNSRSLDVTLEEKGQKVVKVAGWPTLLVGMAASDRDFGGALWDVATGYAPRMACVTERDTNSRSLDITLEEKDQKVVKAAGWPNLSSQCAPCSPCADPLH